MMKELVLLTIATLLALAPTASHAKDIDTSQLKTADLTGRFDQKEWLSNTKSRDKLWKAFIADYNLIGMKKAEMESLLGPPTWNRGPGGPVLVDYPPMPAVKAGTIATYYLGSKNWCGYTSKNVQIMLDSGKVVAWRFYAMLEPDHWYRENGSRQEAHFDAAPSLPAPESADF